MSVASKNNHRHVYLLTIVFVSILLLGVSTHNAFADDVVATIQVGSHPNVVAVNPTTNMIYVTDDSRSLSVIDGATNTVVANIPLGIALTVVDVNPNTNMIYVVGTNHNGDNKIFVIDGSTNQIKTTIQLNGGGFYAGDVKVNPTTNMIYATQSHGYCIGGCHFSVIHVIDGTTNSIIQTVTTQGQLSVIKINPSTNKLYISDGYDGSIRIFDGQTNVFTDRIIGDVPCCMTIDPTTNRLYTSEHNSTGSIHYSNVGIVDLTTNAYLAIIPIDSPAGAKAVNPSTNKLYTAYPNYGNDNTVAVMDLSTNTIVQKLTVGTGPGEMGVNPNTNKIYVANYWDTTVSVIDSMPTTTASLTVHSQDLLGNEITGIWMELHNAHGDTIAEGYTPITFDVVLGKQYAVYANNYLHYAFLHWEDGSMNQYRDITPTLDQTLTATYTP